MQSVPYDDYQEEALRFPSSEIVPAAGSQSATVILAVIPPGEMWVVHAVALFGVNATGSAFLVDGFSAAVVIQDLNLVLIDGVFPMPAVAQRDSGTGVVQFFAGVSLGFALTGARRLNLTHQLQNTDASPHTVTVQRSVLFTRKKLVQSVVMAEARAQGSRMGV